MRGVSMTNQTALKRVDGPDNGSARLPMVVTAEADLAVAESNIKEIIQNSTIPMTEIVKSVSEVIREVEAEVPFDEDITITRKAIRVQRSMRLVKDRPT